MTSEVCSCLPHNGSETTDATKYKSKRRRLPGCMSVFVSSPLSYLAATLGVLQHGVSVFSDGRAVDVRFSQGGETYL